MTRGLDLNNPMNVEHSENKWQGLTDLQTDPTLCSFKSRPFGVRSGERILMAYKSRDLDTVAKIITEWAPSKENPTAQYIKNVCDWTGFTPDQFIDVDTVGVALPLCKSIIRQEQGADGLVSDADIMDGLRLAGVSDAQPKPLLQSKTIIATVVTTGGAALSTASEVTRQLQSVNDTVQGATDTITQTTHLAHHFVHFGPWAATALVALGVSGIFAAKIIERAKLGV